MKHFRSKADDTPPPAAGPATAPDRLAGIRPMAHDDEERPSAQDRDYGQTIFTRPPVPLPRILGGRRKR